MVCLQPCVEALDEIKNKIWRDAEEELGMELHEPSVEVGIPDFVKMRVQAEIMRRQHYSVNTKVMGSSPINGATLQFQSLNLPRQLRKQDSSSGCVN